MVSSVKVIKAISEPGGPMVRVRGGAPPSRVGAATPATGVVDTSHNIISHGV